MACSSRKENHGRSNDFRRHRCCFVFSKWHDLLKGYLGCTSLQDDQNLSLHSVRIVVTVEFCLIAGKYCYETFAMACGNLAILDPLFFVLSSTKPYSRLEILKDSFQESFTIFLSKSTRLLGSYAGLLREHKI